MNPSDDEQDDLWELLGEAREPEVSPFFSRNILREVRALRQEKPGFLGWLRRHWKVPATLVPASAAAAVALLAMSPVQPTASVKTTPKDQLTAIAEQVSASPDYMVISNLDELLASEERSVWLDTSVY